jgi:hypothetical protein
MTRQEKAIRCGIFEGGMCAAGEEGKRGFWVLLNFFFFLFDFMLFGG